MNVMMFERKKKFSIFVLPRNWLEENGTKKKEL